MKTKTHCPEGSGRRTSGAWTDKYIKTHMEVNVNGICNKNHYDAAILKRKFNTYQNKKPTEQAIKCKLNAAD